MEARVMLDGTPVAAVEAVAADEVQCAGDVASLPPDHHEQTAVGHGFAEQREESAVEIRPAPLARAGVHVEVEEGVPVFLVDVAAGQVLDGEAWAKRLGALL